MQLLLVTLLLMSLSEIYADEKCCERELSCTITEKITLGSMASYELNGFCERGGGDVTVTIGSTSVSVPCIGPGVFYSVLNNTQY